MATINVKDAGGLTVPLEKPLIPGQATMANSRPVVIAVDQSPVPVGGSVSITGTIASTQSGAWVVRNQDGSGNALTSAARGAERALSVQVVDGSGNQITTFGGAGGTSSNFGSLAPTAGTAVGLSDGTNMRLPVAIDGDTGGGTQWLTGMVERVPASGGSIGKTYNSGNTDPGTSRVVIASDQTPLTILQGNVNTAQAWLVNLSSSSITLPVNNTAAWDKGSGTGGTATQRMIIDTSQVGPLVNNAVPTVSGGFNYEFVPASTTLAFMGATGAVGDYIEGILCIVSAAATSQVQIADGNGAAMTVLPNNVGGGVGTYYIPLGLKAINVTTPGWRVSTAAGVTAIGTGVFT